MATREDHVGLSVSDEKSSWILQATGLVNSTTNVEVDVNTHALRTVLRGPEPRLTRFSVGNARTSVASFAAARVAQAIYLFANLGSNAVLVQKVLIGNSLSTQTNTSANAFTISLFKGAGYLMTDVPAGGSSYTRIQPQANPGGLKSAQFMPQISFWSSDITGTSYTFGNRTLETQPLSSITYSNVAGLVTVIPPNTYLWDAAAVNMPITILPGEGLEVQISGLITPSTSTTYLYSTEFVWDEFSETNLELGA